MKKFLFTLLVIVVILAGGFYYFVKNPDLPLSQQYLPMLGISVTPTQIANPASVYCEQNSGTVEITNDVSGRQS